MKKLAAALCTSIFWFTYAFPQATGVNAYTPEQLLQMAQPLHAKAKSANGTASETLEKYAGYYTVLVYREKDGEVELHQHDADVMMIVDGSATLVTGGSGEGMKITQPGEMRGKAIRGGSPLKLGGGDIIRIPPNMPHQVLVHPGDSITYLVVKIATGANTK